MAKPFIGIKQLWYGPVLSADLPNVAAINALINPQSGTSDFVEVKNVHDGTWGYSHDDPDTTDYINELTGQPYYRDKTSNGARTITFTLGVYEFQQKKDLQGGEVIVKGGTGDDKDDAIGWKSSGALENVNKCIIAKTKTGNYIVFSNASIVAKGDQQEKNIGLGITAVCMENENNGVAAEYMFDAVTA